MKKFLSFDFLYLLLFSLIIGISFYYLQYHTPGESVEFYKEKYENAYFSILWIALTLLPTIELLYNSKNLQTHRIIFVSSFAFLLFSSVLSYRFNLDFTVIFFIVGIFCLLKERRIYKPTLFTTALILYFLYNLISFYWVDKSIINYKSIRAYYPYLYFAFAFLFVRFSKEEIEHIIKAFYRFMFLFIIFTIITWRHEMLYLHTSWKLWLIERPQYFTEKAITPYNIIFRWTNYLHPTYNGVCALYAFIFGLYFVTKPRINSISKTTGIVLFTASLLFMTVISQSRTTGVGIVVALIVGIGLYLNISKRAKILYFSIAFVFSTLALYSFQDKAKNFIKDPERMHEYSVAIYSIKQKPFWGTGLGAIRNVLDSKEISNKLGYSDGLPDRGNPHNQFLGDMMQTGVIGLTLLICLLGILYYYAIKDRNKLLFLFLITYSLLSLIEMPLSLHKGIILFLPFSLLLIQFNREQKLAYHFKTS